MKETPVSVLCKQIKFYKSFIFKLKTKEGIDKDVEQNKLDNLICECEEKTKEFETAIKILDPTAKIDQSTVADNAEKFNLTEMDKSIAILASCHRF